MLFNHEFSIVINHFKWLHILDVHDISIKIFEKSTIRRFSIFLYKKKLYMLLSENYFFIIIFFFIQNLSLLRFFSNNNNNYKNMLAKVYEIHLNINET